jgi:putative colanic acid biosynthesis acetyltransferase WcaF
MFELEKFKLPSKFRGRNAIIVQLWRIIYVVFFKTSPQFLYCWRRFLLRLFGAKVGKKVIIRPTAQITYPWKIEIGDYTWIGDNVVLYSLGKITIGSNTIISQKSYLCTGSHHINSVAFDIFEKPIVIGHSCWIATDVFIAPGVQIADEVIIGARSSVYKSIETKGIYKGNPVTKKEI